MITSVNIYKAATIQLPTSVNHWWIIGVGLFMNPSTPPPPPPGVEYTLLAQSFIHILYQQSFSLWVVFHHIMIIGIEYSSPKSVCATRKEIERYLGLTIRHGAISGFFVRQWDPFPICGHSDECHGSVCKGNDSENICVGPCQCYLPHRVSHTWFPHSRANWARALARNPSDMIPSKTWGTKWGCTSMTLPTHLPIWLSCDISKYHPIISDYQHIMDQCNTLFGIGKRITNVLSYGSFCVVSSVTSTSLYEHSVEKETVIRIIVFIIIFSDCLTAILIINNNVLIIFLVLLTILAAKNSAINNCKQ